MIKRTKRSATPGARKPHHGPHPAGVTPPRSAGTDHHAALITFFDGRSMYITGALMADVPALAEALRRFERDK